MTTYLLIRHGLTDAVGKTLAGWLPGFGLNPAGRVQAESLAVRLARLPIAALYVSPLQRTVETAQPIAETLNLGMQIVDDLGEFRFGEWEGLAIQELHANRAWQRFNAQRHLAAAPGGESMMECQNRMVRVLDSLRERHDQQMIAVVSHADPVRAALAAFLNAPLSSMLRFEVNPASVSVVEVSDSYARVLCLNSIGDLPL